MTSAALSWGCAFSAFSPFLSLLFVICYSKAQLVIVVTTSAFCFLLSSLGASLVWYILDFIGWHQALPVLLPSILFQFILRCVFTKVYHMVERVIEVSIQRHEQHTDEFQETLKLRLELNDWACGIAAGTGFGGMHAVLLYGTLLASESSTDNLGTLYQPSCSFMPSLVLSAINTFLFSILDILWMLLTFYGMRQRSLNQLLDLGGSRRAFGAILPRTKKGGNFALLIVLVTHSLASFLTTLNSHDDGCVMSIPLLLLTTILTGLVFWGGVSKIYLPASQRQRVGIDGSNDGNAVIASATEPSQQQQHRE